jgi:pyruvate formate lyase activating enzyme
MKIAGFQPFSLCDYPGRVASVVFTQGCNFHCGFCHNGGLIRQDVPATGLMSQDDCLQRLADRAGFLEGVVVSGGEPTLQPDLGEFCRRVKALGLLVKLDTNGSRPDVLRAAIEGRWIDFVAMDVKAPFDRYRRVTCADVETSSIEASIRLIAGSGVEHEFRTTWVRSLLTEADLAALRSILPPGSPYRVQPFVPELAADPGLRLAS